MQEILIEWFYKHFGHILEGRTDTAEYARTGSALDALMLLTAPIPLPPLETSLPPLEEVAIESEKPKKIKKKV